MAKPTLPERIEGELVKLLKERRESLHLSKKGTAEKAGMAIMTISFVENGERCPSINTLLKIAGALEVDLWELLKQATIQAKRSGG